MHRSEKPGFSSVTVAEEARTASVLSGYGITRRWCTLSPTEREPRYLSEDSGEVWPPVNERIQDPDQGRPTAASGTLRFSVDAALLFQLGEELVRKRSVALAELIKNAYDADSTRVTVTFREVRTPGGTIVVADNGTGMAFDHIQSEWMRIATSRKAREQVSERFRRVRTGAKGLGRFAARRLAAKLSLTSVAKVSAGLEETFVDFDWDAFTPGAEVQTVGVRYRRRLLPPSGTKSIGTELRLLGTRDAWNEEDLGSLTQELGRLVAPHDWSLRPAGDPGRPPAGARADPGIRIRLEASEFPNLSGDIREQSLKGALAVLEGALHSNGIADYTVRFRESKRTLHFRPKTRFKDTGAARFRIHFFVYKKDYFAGIGINVRDAVRRGREEGGVHLYVDRFRVPPYGDPGDDWLKLDEDRGRRLVKTPVDLARLARGIERPMLLLPGNNQLFGRVFLSRRTNPEIRQTLNREGVIETSGFDELRKFVRTGINYLTVAYARETAAHRREAKGRRDRPQDAAALLESAKQNLVAASKTMPGELRVQVLQAIDLARQTIQTQQQELITELSMLRVLASTGTMLVVFEHQLLGTLNGLRASHRGLAARLPLLAGNDRERVAAELGRLDTWIKSAQHQAELLGLLVARKARSRRRRIPVHPAVGNMKLAFKSYTDDYGITLDNSVVPALKTPAMFEAELNAILVNLLTNAFKAVREQPVRRVEVVGAYRSGATVIQVRDTGIGAARDRWEEFFEPFVGESEPDPILGEGTGLGLKIVRDFVGVYGGTARFVQPESPWRTCLEVSLPEE